MKYNFTIQEIDKIKAVEFIQSKHYSKVMPRLTKHYLGIYDKEELAGVVTLGWGTQPLQTIRKLFPTLITQDYYEIGKMCMDDRYPRNSETQMLSALFKWIQVNCPNKKFLYTWADGIVGKAGYVYQAFNFWYGGYIWTDIYVGADGEKIHPRSSKALLQENAKMLGREKLFWLTPDFLRYKGIRRIKGKQFRYILPLAKNYRKLLKESTVEWSRNYPKDAELQWKEQIDKGQWRLLERMPSMDLSVVNINRKNVEEHTQRNLTS